MQAGRQWVATLGFLAVGGLLDACGDSSGHSSVNPCVVGKAYTVGSTVGGDLAASDCHLGDGSFVDYYTFNATATESLRFTLTSSAFNAFLLLEDSQGNPLAVDDDGTGTSDASFKLLLGTGKFRVGANSLDPAVTGAYSLTSASVASDVGACEDVWVTRGISTAQTIATTDCGPTTYADGFLVALDVGQSITVAENSSAFDAKLQLISGTAQTIVAGDDNSGGGTNALMSYTATTADLYILFASTASAGQTGAYTLTIQ